MQSFTVESHRRCEFINIDRKVQAVINQDHLDRGAILVFVPHTTAGVTINENADPDVVADMEGVLDRIVPWQGPYAHAEGNTAAHVKASMMGSSVMVLVEHSRLQLGTWQSIYLCEFDGPRTRKVWIQTLADE